MTYLFMNLKRFDVPAQYGGLNRTGSPAMWVDSIARRTAQLALGTSSDRTICYLMPEAHLTTMISTRHEVGGSFSVGCQGVHPADVGEDNFGAFTSSTPAAAIVAAGAEWVIIGHSEERRDKGALLSSMPGVQMADVAVAVNRVLADEVARAAERELSVLLCVGETAEERAAAGSDWLSGVRAVVRRQLVGGLSRIADAVATGSHTVVLGYEPIWAIGPGRTPPDAYEVDAIAGAIKEECRELFGRELPVVYGGGLKRANAAPIGGADSVDGGLVALTRFEQPIGFDVDEFEAIIDEYEKGAKR